jgi:polyhydroxyalkanoate synthesis regulator phasin
MAEEHKVVSWRDLLEKTVDLGLGAALLTKEAATKLVEDLVKRGSMSKEEGHKVVCDMLEKGKEQKARMESLVRQTVDRMLAQADLARQSSMQELERRVRDLERELKRAQGTTAEEPMPPVSECI